MSKSLNKVLQEARKCRLCEKHLPLGPRPIVTGHKNSKIMIIGQAPGTKVHDSGQSWNDRSGDHLREWLQMDRDVFYNQKLISIMPMGFCYPGKAQQGDKPPRRECAPLWHSKIREALPNIQLTLLVGAYAQKYYLKERCKSTMAETVQNWKDYLPEFFPLPHPSWRSRGWIQNNPWFETELLPDLKKIVDKILADDE